MKPETSIQPPALAAATEATPAPEAMAETPEANVTKPQRLDPTRYGDWELNGKCVDF